MPTNIHCRNPLIGLFLLLLFLLVIAPFALLALTGTTFASVFANGLCTPWLIGGIILTMLIIIASLFLIWFSLIRRIKKLSEPFFKPLIVILRASADAIELASTTTDGLRVEFSNISSNLTSAATALNQVSVEIPHANVKSLSQVLSDLHVPGITADPNHSIKVLDGTFFTQRVYPLLSVGSGVNTVAGGFSNVAAKTQDLKNNESQLASQLRSVAGLIEGFIL